jgi:hypothetical protein
MVKKLQIKINNISLYIHQTNKIKKITIATNVQMWGKEAVTLLVGM